MNTDRLNSIITPLLAEFDLELEALDVVGDGGRTILRVIVDGDGPDGTGPLLDDIAEATRAVSRALDDTDATGERPYTLEVSSRGLSRPLTAARHWRRNRGRLVKISRPGEAKILGRIVDVAEDRVGVDIDGTVREFALDDIGTAVVQPELRKESATDEGEE